MFDDDYVLIIPHLSCLPPPPHAQCTAVVTAAFRILNQEADGTWNIPCISDPFRLRVVIGGCKI